MKSWPWAKREITQLNGIKVNLNICTNGMKKLIQTFDEI